MVEQILFRYSFLRFSGDEAEGDGNKAVQAQGHQVHENSLIKRSNIALRVIF